MSDKQFTDDFDIIRAINRLIGTSWIDEVPIGAIDSSNKVFIASKPMWSQSLIVFVDGKFSDGAIVERDKRITVSLAPTTSIHIKYISTDINK